MRHQSMTEYLQVSMQVVIGKQLRMTSPFRMTYPFWIKPWED